MPEDGKVGEYDPGEDKTNFYALDMMCLQQGVKCILRRSLELLLRLLHVG